MQGQYDVVIVGGGNAAFSAAHAAREHAERVLILEKAPAEWAGGNTYFTLGAMRTTYNGLEDLRPVLDDLSEEQAARIDLPAYTVEDFERDMQRVTEGRCDNTLSRILIDEAAESIHWLHEKGLRFTLMYGHQSFEVDGVTKFWGGLALRTVDGGKGMVQQHIAAAKSTGIEIRYETPVVGLLQEGNSVKGVVCEGADGGREEIRASAVVLAAGGFEADPQMRAAYLGPQWDVAKVRGTPHNTGEVLRLAVDAGAQPYGNWSGCHAIAWDAMSPATGDYEYTNRYSRKSYPFGIMVNKDAKRFVDEGADFHNYTYAKYGAEILRQPGSLAYQLFDAKTESLLREDEYTTAGASRYEAVSVRGLAEALGLAPETLDETVQQFNDAVQAGDFDPSIKDGKRTVGLEPAKSNWAQPLDTPPFYGFAVTTGITFTFGGLRIDTDGGVLDRLGREIPNLYAAGEMVGGLFYSNYPGGSGLTSGAVFGRRAGRAAAQLALQSVDLQPR